MRIWTFNHYASTPDEQMTAPFDIAKALVRKGHEVTIFASSFSHYKFLELKLRKSETWQVEVLDGVLPQRLATHLEHGLVCVEDMARKQETF